MLGAHSTGKLQQGYSADAHRAWNSAIPTGDLDNSQLLSILNGRAPRYEAFLALVEVLCVILVFFRRTRPAGALLAIAVVTNIFWQDISYSIPMLRPAVVLLALAVLLATTYSSIYRGAFLAMLRVSESDSLSRNVRIAGTVFKTMLVAFIIYMGVRASARAAVLKSPGPFLGAWCVDSIEGRVPQAGKATQLAPGSSIYFEGVSLINNVGNPPQSVAAYFRGSREMAVQLGNTVSFGKYEANEVDHSMTLSVYNLGLAEADGFWADYRPATRVEYFNEAKLAYRLTGQYTKVDANHVQLQFTDEGNPIVVMLRARKLR